MPLTAMVMSLALDARSLALVFALQCLAFTYYFIYLAYLHNTILKNTHQQRTQAGQLSHSVTLITAPYLS